VPKEDEDRKERVIHARIPASLEAEIKRMASRLRIPVSNLVRNMLSDAVAMVEGVQQNVDETLGGLRAQLGRLEHKVEQAGAAEAARPAQEPTAVRAAAALERVFGWQELWMNQPAECARCGRALDAGTRALFGMTGHPSDRVFCCPECVQR
jgi:hypothetical protein